MHKAIKAAALAAGKDENYYLSIPLTAALRVASGSNATIRSGQTTTTLTCSVAPAAYASSPALGKWQFTASNPGMVQITPGSNNSITVAGTNKTAAPVDVIIVAKNELGLEACARLKVEPAFVEPPKFTRDPAITQPADGRVTLGYALDLGSDLRKDESSITWYRCTDGQGSNPLKVAVSRRNKPEIAYTLSEGDVGYYLMATIRPKHSLSEVGPMQTVYARSIIAKDDVKIHVIDTDFQNFPDGSSAQDSPRHLDVGRLRCARSGSEQYTTATRQIPTRGPMARARAAPSITMACTRPPAARACSTRRRAANMMI